MSSTSASVELSAFGAFILLPQILEGENASGNRQLLQQVNHDLCQIHRYREWDETEIFAQSPNLLPCISLAFRMGFRFTLPHSFGVPPFRPVRARTETPNTREPVQALRDVITKDCY
jgi:hypothetical protein